MIGVGGGSPYPVRWLWDEKRTDNIIANLNWWEKGEDQKCKAGTHFYKENCIYFEPFPYGGDCNGNSGTGQEAAYCCDDPGIRKYGDGEGKLDD